MTKSDKIFGIACESDLLFKCDIKISMWKIMALGFSSWGIYTVKRKLDVILKTLRPQYIRVDWDSDSFMLGCSV